MGVWSLECVFAGRTFYPALESAPSVSSRANIWRAATAARSADVTFLDDIGIALLVSRGHRPQTGVGRLFYNDVLIVEGSWQSTEFGPLGSPVSITIGESAEDDVAVVPATGDILRSLNDEEMLTGTSDVLLGGVVPVEFNGFMEGTPQAVKTTWSNIARKAEGRVYPMVFGAPGSSTQPGSPALFVDTASSAEEWLIAGHMVDAATVTLWGPGPEGELVSHSGVTVRHKDDSAGRKIAYVISSDLSSNAQNSTSGGGELVLGSGVQFDPSGDFYVSWTGGDALPGGAGDVLLLLLRISSLTVDFGAWHSVRQRLNAYLLAGYVDDEVQPSALALTTIAKDLPVSAEYGLYGLRPVLWPWLDDLDALTASAHIVCGTRDPDTGTFSEGFLSYLAGGITYTSDAAMTVYTIEHGYNPESSAYTLSATISPTDTAYGASAASSVGYTPKTSTSKTRWIADTATATSLASTRMRAHSVPRRVVRCLCDADQYGPGGPEELYCGRPVLVSVSSLHITAEPGHIAALGWKGPVLDVTIELRDDPLRTTTSGAVSETPVDTTVYLMLVGDDGTSNSYATSSTNATSFSAVSGMPNPEGVLNAIAYDEDNEQFMGVGQTGASCLIARDGSSVTDTNVGGTTNRNGVSYRKASESGGALWVVVGSSGALDYSSDGTSFTTVTGFGSTALYLSFYHSGQGFFVGGNSGKMWVSANGTGSYTACDPGASQRITDMAWSGTYLVISRRSGKVYYAAPASASSGSWTAATSGVSQHLLSIASDQSGTVVAVGNSGTIIRSTDHGVNWSTGTSGVTSHLRSVAYSGDLGFVICGDSGVVLTSSDGASWSSQTSGAPDDLLGVQSSAGYP